MLHYWMDEEEVSASSSMVKNKKPGPRPTKCLWCGSTECTHCRCTGQNGCSHKKGEMCSNPRYKRRLVCNSCEKNKLREKQKMNMSSSARRKRGKAATKNKKKHITPKAIPKPPVPVKQEEVKPVQQPEVVTQQPVVQCLNVYLVNQNRTIGNLYVHSNVITLSSVRPFINQLLSRIEGSSDFLFIHGGRNIPFEQENQVYLHEINRLVNNILEIDIVNVAPTVPLYQPYREMSNHLVPDLIGIQHTPIQTPLPSAPLQGMIPNPPPIPTSTVLESYPRDNGWNPNENPVQRMIREANASGRMETVMNQAQAVPNEFMFDDAPRELHSRGNSYNQMGSVDNFFSRPGSMIFPPTSRQGSMMFNYFGSNLSMDNRNPYDDLVSKLRSIDDDFDKGAPSL